MVGLRMRLLVASPGPFPSGMGEGRGLSRSGSGDVGGGPDWVFQAGDERGVGGSLGRGGDEEVDAAGAGGGVGYGGGGLVVVAGEEEAALATAGEFDIDVGEETAVEEGVVAGALGKVDGETAAEGVEAVG